MLRLKPLRRKHNDRRGSEIFLGEMSSEHGPSVYWQRSMATCRINGIS